MKRIITTALATLAAICGYSQDGTHLPLTGGTLSGSLTATFLKAEASFPKIDLVGQQAAGRSYSLTSYILGVTNAGFAIRDNTANVNVFTIDGANTFTLAGSLNGTSANFRVDNSTVTKNIALSNWSTTNNAGTSIYMGYAADSGDPYGIRLVQNGNPTATRSGSFAIQRHGNAAGDGDWLNSLSIDYSGNTTLSGSLTGTSATFSAPRSLVSTGVDVILANTGGAHDIIFGDNNSRYYSLHTPVGAATGSIRNYSTATDILSWTAGGAATFSSSISATNATFSSPRSLITTGADVILANSGGAHDIIFGDNNLRYYSLHTPAGAATGSIRNYSTTTDILSWTDAGFVGVGTANPEAGFKLDVNGLGTIGTSGSARIYMGTTDANNAFIQSRNSTINQNLKFYASEYKFDVGNVGIGANILDPDAKLTVGGKIHSREVKVTIAAGADFVFQKDYNLKSLTEVAKYISENKHLPDVASAEEMKKNGLELGEMNIKLLQKVEELTLYMIDFNKKMDAVQEENQILKKKVAKLEEANK